MNADSQRYRTDVNPLMMPSGLDSNFEEGESLLLCEGKMLDGNKDFTLNRRTNALIGNVLIIKCSHTDSFDYLMGLRWSFELFKTLYSHSAILFERPHSEHGFI